VAVTQEFREHLLDLFGGLGPVTIRRMFGGLGLYLDDACFALVFQETIKMRGDAELGPEFEAAGSEQWTYQREGREAVAMPYWQLPDSAMDDPDEAATWARRSLGPAQLAAAEKAAAKARRAARKATGKTSGGG